MDHNNRKKGEEASREVFVGLEDDGVAACMRRILAREVRPALEHLLLRGAVEGGVDLDARQPFRVVLVDTLGILRLELGGVEAEGMVVALELKPVIVRKACTPFVKE